MAIPYLPLYTTVTRLAGSGRRWVCRFARGIDDHYLFPRNVPLIIRYKVGSCFFYYKTMALYKIVSPSTVKFISRFLFAPYIGAGIRLSKVSPDFLETETRLKLRWYNRNLVGTHFGGSLFSMTDPFYMLMLAYHIGEDHYVWDKNSYIEFLKPGKSEVRANFKITQEQIDDIVKLASDEKPHDLHFQVDVIDESDEIVAKVKKTLYIRKKSKQKKQQL